MKCLHICNDLMGSKVHENLYKNLNGLDLDQIIYYPLRKHAIGKVANYNTELSEFVVTSKLLSNAHRIFFKKKINLLYEDLKSKVDLSSLDIVHATTLFSDGAIAFKIWKDFGIPYVVALRGTDINVFFKYRLDLHPLGNEIIANASKLIFISDSLKENFDQIKSINTNGNKLAEKCTIVPNGLDSYWLNNIVKKKQLTPLNFLYIGKFNSNKNVIRLIKVFLKIAKKHKNLQLNLVGSGGRQEKKIRKLAEKFKENLNFHGPIYDKNELQEMYQANDIFAMASISETFGLVYVEALTQGLPILFTEKQGIDGTFKEYVGEAVNPKSVKSMTQGMKNLIKNHSKYEIDKVDFSRFSWEGIAKTYLDLYKTVLKENK